METYILKKSNQKNKRFVIIMQERNHRHNFGSDKGKTYIDGRTQKEKENWIARHRVNTNWDNKHSSIFFSRHLLWGKHTDLKKNIKELEKLLNVKIKVEL
tara:strand:+ start:475 stop:774 length:300 start_codon:yes stop_codon:yes gene_type:complete